jgi:hypothetical protein
LVNVRSVTHWQTLFHLCKSFHVLLLDMEGEHDDEPTRWTSIGWQALLITNRLRVQAQLTEPHEKQDEQGKHDPERSGDEEKKRAEEREYIERRLRELAAFERRVRGLR